MTAEKVRELDVAQIAASIETLDCLEIAVLGMMSKGWSNVQIAKAIHADGPVKAKRLITQARKKLGMTGWSREALAVVYTRYVLPLDTWLNYKEPGEKLAVWTQRAEEIRATLQANGLLDGWPAEAVMQLTDLAYTDRSPYELKDLLTRERLVTVEAYRAGLLRLFGAIPGGNKIQFVTIATLAPFDAPTLPDAQRVLAPLTIRPKCSVYV